MPFPVRYCVRDVGKDPGNRKVEAGIFSIVANMDGSISPAACTNVLDSFYLHYEFVGVRFEAVEAAGSSHKRFYCSESDGCSDLKHPVKFLYVNIIQKVNKRGFRLRSKCFIYLGRKQKIFV